MMRATTGQILGKAHRLCEWLRKDDIKVYPNVSTVPLSWGIENSSKWHVGNANDLPAGLDRDVIDALPMRLPAKQMLIEFECHMLMTDGSEGPMTGFALCYDNGDESIDCFFFGFGDGQFWFSGGARMLCADGHRALRLFRPADDAAAEKKIVSGGVAIVERALVALSCTNVRSVDNAPPAALNKKRQKQGKPPLFTYKTLHVLAGERGASHDPRADDAEAKRSPRLHFRRGHVRRIGGGRITWVQQCMVGNGRLGVIDKAYALEAR